MALAFDGQPARLFGFAVAAWIAVALQGCGSKKPSKVVGSCGPNEPSHVEDCHNEDFGSCGGACCSMIFQVEGEVAETLAALKATLANGGPDGAYSLQETDKGNVGFDDLSKITSKLPHPLTNNSALYIGQVQHETKGKYYDSLDFLLYSAGTGTGRTTVQAFSLSLIGGAMGDNGQNYKNIVMVMKAALGTKTNVAEAYRVGKTCTPPEAVITDSMAEEDIKYAQVRKLQVKTEASVPSLMGGASDVPGTCGHDLASTVPDCQNNDMGHCGTACCNLLMTVDEDATLAMKMLQHTLSQGGPDGMYKLKATAEGTSGFADLADYTNTMPLPFTNLTKLYLGQANHQTSGPKHYNDTMNIQLFETGGRTMVHAFSKSLVPGALLDYGQNYKNIVALMKSTFKNFDTKTHLFGSCPQRDPMLV
mmetsp:Transcript_1658/g.3910  ORF Transcript_1658/g.3910 Transcript_1658/m.3910 type:complete len:421 (-) Transcript_1658:207-1469(-)